MTVWLSTCLLLQLLAGQVPQKGPCTVYMYLDDAGNSIRTRKLDSVPADKQNSVVTYQDCNFKPSQSKKTSFSYTQESQEPSEALDLAEESIWDWFKRRHRELERWQTVAVLICLAMFLGGLIGIVVAAFRVGLLWGLAVLFLPIVPVVFVIIYWRETKVPFAAWLLGWLGAGFFGYLI